MNLELLKKISIRGRLALGATMLKNALIKERINNKESSLLLDKIWEFTSSITLDEWEQMIKEITPIVILDPRETFDDYVFFDKTLLLKMKEMYVRMPEYLIDIIDYTISIGTDNIYAGTGEYSEASLEATIQVITICSNNDVPIPIIDLFEQFPFVECKGWGRTFDRDEAMW